MSRVRQGALAATLALVAGVAQAQPVTQLADPPAAAPSRWAVDVARIDGEARMRALVVADPRGNWVAGHFDATDPAEQVRRYAAARVAAPGERLYLASLALACQQPVQPAPPECDAVDRLADWATRDADNGVPMLMLAAKAARRGDNDAANAYLEQAASLPRMDDYWSRGWLDFWEFVMAIPIDADRAAKAEAAAGYAAAQPQTAANGLVNLCSAASSASPARRAACAKAGTALAERGATFAVRSAGAAIAERNVVDAAAADRVRADRVANDGLRARCAAQDLDVQQAALSSDPLARARAVAAWEDGVRAKAARGEVAACAQRA